MRRAKTHPRNGRRYTSPSHFERRLCAIELSDAYGSSWPVSDLWLEGPDWPMAARTLRWRALPAPLAMVVRLDAGNGQLVGGGGQFGCQPWSVSLAKLVNCCGEGGQFCTSGTGERDGAYAMSLQVRERIEQSVCWIQTIGGLRKLPLVALPTVRGWVTWTCAA